jgi:hypothetical protein
LRANLRPGFLDFIFNTNSAGHKRIGLISYEAEGTTPNQRGGLLRLFTKPNASGSALERMRINSSGNVGIGTTSPGNHKSTTQILRKRLLTWTNFNARFHWIGDLTQRRSAIH